jgi:hypothetical protein
MRKFRGERSQAAFARELGTTQTIISRLENPNYSGWSLRTMLETARKLDVAVFVRFVDFPTFLRYSGDLSEAALHPEGYNEATITESVEQADLGSIHGGGSDGQRKDRGPYTSKPQEFAEARGDFPAVPANDDHKPRQPQAMGLR